MMIKHYIIPYNTSVKEALTRQYVANLPFRLVPGDYYLTRTNGWWVVVSCTVGYDDEGDIALICIIERTPSHPL